MVYSWTIHGYEFQESRVVFFALGDVLHAVGCVPRYLLRLASIQHTFRSLVTYKEHSILTPIAVPDWLLYFTRHYNDRPFPVASYIWRTFCGTRSLWFGSIYLLFAVQFSHIYDYCSSLFQNTPIQYIGSLYRTMHGIIMLPENLI